MIEEILYSLENCFKKANKAADEKEKQSLTFGYMIELEHTKNRIKSYLKRNKLTNVDVDLIRNSIQKMNDNLGLVTHKLHPDYFKWSSNLKGIGVIECKHYEKLVGK